MNFDPTPYNIGEAFLHWLTIFGSVLGIVLVIALFTSILARGFRGPGLVLGQIRDAVVDTVRMSLRRVWAITMLTFRESIRRKALLVFVVFGILFMFAGWFLSTANNRPDMQVKVYVSFVLTAVSW